MPSGRGVSKDMVMRGIKELDQLNSLEKGSRDPQDQSKWLSTSVKNIPTCLREKQGLPPSIWIFEISGLSSDHFA